MCLNACHPLLNPPKQIKDEPERSSLIGLVVSFIKSLVHSCCLRLPLRSLIALFFRHGTDGLWDRSRTSSLFNVHVGVPSVSLVERQSISGEGQVIHIEAS